MGCRGNQRQRCKTVGSKGGDAEEEKEGGEEEKEEEEEEGGFSKSGEEGGFTLASWKERLDEACRLRPNTLLLGASKVKK